MAEGFGGQDKGRRRLESEVVRICRKLLERDKVRTEAKEHRCMMLLSNRRLKGFLKAAEKKNAVFEMRRK